MKKIIAFLLFALISGCSLIHKNPVEQGNVYSSADIARLHRGMSEAAVKDILGNPIVVNIFANNRLDYIYTYQPSNQAMTEKKLTLVFIGGRLQDINQS